MRSVTEANPLAVPAQDREIVGLRAAAEAMPPACPDRHGVLAVADAYRCTARAALHEFPARRVRIAETRKPSAGREARKARRLPHPAVAKERLKGQVQPAQCLLQGVTDELRTIDLDRRQHVLLLVIADRPAGLAPGVNPLLGRRVV
jgi:hypothetical protein